MIELIRLWLRHFFRRARVEREVDEEIRACLDLLTAEKMRAGMSPAQARRQAVLRTGGIEPLKEHIRQTSPAARVHAFGRDLHYGARLLRRRPLFAITAILSLAIATGATTAVYAWGSAMFRRDPAGVTEPDRLVAVFVDDNDPSTDYNTLSFPHFREIQRASGAAFSSMGGAARFWAALSTGRGAQSSTVEYATGHFFATVGVPLTVGRGISAEDDVAGAPQTIVLSDHLWRNTFGGSANVLGQTVRLNGQPFTVVGVVSPLFEGLEYSFYGEPDAWVAASAYGLVTGSSRFSGRAAALRTVARLQPGITRATAEAALAPVGTTLSYEKTDYQRYTTIRVFSLRDARIPSYTRQALRESFNVLLIVAALLIAAACVNIANFLLSQSVTRQDEMTLRLALGATRRQLGQQLLTECLLLGGIGGTAGFGLAFLFADLLERFPIARNVGSALKTPVPIDMGVGWFAVGVSSLTIVGFGLIPAWLASSRAPLAGRRAVGAWSTRRGLRVRQLILGLQVAVAVTLSVVAGLYARSLLRIERLVYPYQTDAILLARLNPTALPTAERTPFYADVLAQVRARPEVVAAGYSYNPLLSIGAMRVRTRPDAPFLTTDFSTVGPGFFGAIGVPLKGGREFRDEDLGAHVAIMNATLAEKLWPGEDAVGRTILFPSGAYGERLAVVGVVDQPRCSDRLTRPFPCIYVPLNFTRDPSETLHVRVKTTAAPFGPVVRSLVQHENPDAIVEQTLTLGEHISALRTGPRVTSTLTAGMALLAGVLSALGCSALLLALVQENRREMAIRLAIGCTPRALARSVMTWGMVPYAAGCALGLLMVWSAASRIGPQLYDTGVHDTLAFVIPALTLTIVGVMASYWPTRVAVRGNLAVLLRD